MPARNVGVVPRQGAPPISTPFPVPLLGLLLSTEWFLICFRPSSFLAVVSGQNRSAVIPAPRAGTAPRFWSRSSAQVGSTARSTRVRPSPARPAPTATSAQRFPLPLHLCVFDRLSRPLVECNRFPRSATSASTARCRSSSRASPAPGHSSSARLFAASAAAPCLPLTVRSKRQGRRRRWPTPPRGA